MVGEPIRIPPGISTEQVGTWSQHLHDVLEQLDSQAEERGESTLVELPSVGDKSARLRFAPGSENLRQRIDLFRPLGL